MQSAEHKNLDTSASEDVEVSSVIIEDSDTNAISDSENRGEYNNNSFDAFPSGYRERNSSVIIHDVERKLTPRSKSPGFNNDGSVDNLHSERLSPRPKHVSENNSKKEESFDTISSDDSSDSEDSDDDSDYEDLPLEQQLEREKGKSTRANDTISALLQQITQYKTAIEGEKDALENQMKEERNRWKKEEKQLKNQIIKLDKQVDNLNLVLNQTAADYEIKLQELEEEKTTRSKETIENLQTLIRELNYIEEVNEDLTRQLDREHNVKKNLQEELQTSKQLIDQLTAKITTLEEENANISVKNGKGFREVMHLVSPRGPTSPASPGKDGDTNNLALELNKMKLLYAQAVQDLEKERTRIQSIDLLVNQIKIITAPVTNELSSSNQSGEAEEKRVLLKKLLEEKEAHSNTLQTLNDERKKSTNDREYMDSLSQRIKDLIQSHSNTLKQLEEERDNVRKGKEIVKELQAEIKALKSEKKGKLLILSSLEQEGGVEVSPLMSEEDDNKASAPKEKSPVAKANSDSESSGKSSPTVPSARGVYVPELRLETAPNIKPLRPGLRTKFPPAGNKPAFFSLRHKKSHSTGYFPEFTDDNTTDFDLSDLPQSVSGAKIRATLRRYMKKQEEDLASPPDARTPEVRTPEGRTPEVRSPLITPREPDENAETTQKRPRDGSLTERSDRSRLPRRQRSDSKGAKEDIKRKSLNVPKLNIPAVDDKEKQTARLAQSAREATSDDRNEEFQKAKSMAKGKYESEPKLNYSPRKDNPFLDLINEGEKKKKKEKKSKKEKRPERKGSFGSGSVDSMQIPPVQPEKMRRNTMDKKLWAQMLSSGFYN